MVAVAAYVTRAGARLLDNGGQYWVVGNDAAWLIYPPALSPVTEDLPEDVALQHGQLTMNLALLEHILPLPPGARLPGAASAGTHASGHPLGSHTGAAGTDPGSAGLDGVAAPGPHAHPASGPGGGGNVSGVGASGRLPGEDSATQALSRTSPKPGAAPALQTKARPRPGAPPGLIRVAPQVAAAGGAVLDDGGQWWITNRGSAWLVYPPSASPITISDPGGVAVRDGQLYLSAALLARVLPPVRPADTVAAAVYGQAVSTPLGTVPPALLNLGSKIVAAPASPPPAISIGGFLGGILTAVNRWLGLIRAVATTAIPSTLIRAVMAQESGGQASVVSSAGAVGLMQIMPTSVSALLLRIPAVNIWYGSRLLNGLAREFGLAPSCWHGGQLAPSCQPALDLVLGGYNAGPGNAAYWREIPETNRYVRDVEAVLAVLTGNGAAG